MSWILISVYLKVEFFSLFNYWKIDLIYSKYLSSDVKIFYLTVLHEMNTSRQLHKDKQLFVFSKILIIKFLIICNFDL